MSNFIDQEEFAQKEAEQFSEISTPNIESESNTPIEIMDIEIHLLKDSIKGKLKNVLEKMNCITIQDVLRITPEALAKQDSVGGKTVADFNSLLIALAMTPIQIKEEADKYLPKTLPNIISEDFFENIENIIDNYFIELNNVKARDIFFRRYGLRGNNRYTLEEIGQYYDLSRERIRQIEASQFGVLGTLLNGEINRHPHVVINAEIVANFLKLKQTFVCIKFLTEIDAIEKAKISLGLENEVGGSIFLFVMEILGFAHSYYNDIGYFYLNKDFRNQEFVKLCNTIISILQQVVKPICLFDVVIKLKKDKIAADSTTVEQAISVLSEVETLLINSEKYFQICISKLLSLRDMAFRILSEKQKEMHAKEIFREIQHQLVTKGTDSRETVRSMTGQMVLDKRFKPVGRTGKWILSEWPQNTQSLIELVVNAFHHYNEPCSAKMIVEYASSLRDDIRPESIPSILLQNKQKFLKIGRGLYILKEWQHSYPDAQAVGEVMEIVTSDDLHSLLIKIFRDSAQNELPLKKIIERLEDYDIFWSESYCFNRLEKCLFLAKQKKGIKNYYSIKPVPTDIEPVKTIKKLDLLKNLIIEQINTSKQRELPLRDIVKILVTKGEIRANIYSVINKNQEVFKKETREKTVYISLFNITKDNSLHLNPSQKHIDDIKKGEGRTIEFKSTLRWDLRENKVNKDLEFVVIKAIAAFLNSEGGCLYVGVDDSSNILGIQNDIRTLSKKNVDGLGLHLNQLITQFLGKGAFAFIKHSVIDIDGKSILCVEVKKASNPIYINDGKLQIFVIRAAASVQVLDIKDAITYINENWKHN